MARTLLIIGLVLVGLAALMFASMWVVSQPPLHMVRTAHALIGRPKAELVKALGKPQYEISSATLAGRSVDYPWKGMHFVPVPNRPVQNKVLLYSMWDVAIYVYIDERGLIEHVAVAGT
jgi:hypothetical protein